MNVEVKNLYCNMCCGELVHWSDWAAALEPAGTLAQHDHQETVQVIIYSPPQAKLIFPGISGGLQADWQFSLLPKNKDPGQTTRTVSTLLTSSFTQSRRWRCHSHSHSHSARACVESRGSRVRPSSASSSFPSDPVSQEPPTAQHLSCVSPSHADSLGQHTEWIGVGSETNENKIRKSRSGSFWTAGKSLIFQWKLVFRS